MNVKNRKKCTFVCERGFSLIEALFAMAATLVILAASVGIFNSVMNMGDTATHISNASQDIQASLNLIRRDLHKIANIPGTGLQLPGDEWGTNRWCDGVNCNVTPTAGATLILAGVSGKDRGLGADSFVLDPVIPGQVNNSDAISILCESDFAGDINVIVRNEQNNTRIELDPTSIENAQRFAAIRPGDLIYLDDTHLQHVTSVVNNSINLNRTDQTRLNTNMSFADGTHTNARLVRLVTYYLEQSSDNGSSWLMRQVNFRPAVRLIPGVTAFDLTYDEGNSTAGPVFVEQFIGSDTDGNDSGFFTDHPDKVMDIRRVNITITCDAETAFLNNTQTVESTQTAQIAVRRYTHPVNFAEEPVYFTVTYNANLGGTDEFSELVEAGTQYTILGSNSMNFPIQHTRVFSNWNTQPNGRGTTYPVNSRITVTNDITLFARWVIFD